MKIMILITFFLFSNLAFSAEKAGQPAKPAKKLSAVKKHAETKSLPVPKTFNVNDRICFRYNPNNPAYFEMVVKSVSDAEIVVSSVLKDSKEVKEPHDEKYAPAEFRKFLEGVKIIPCK